MTDSIVGHGKALAVGEEGWPDGIVGVVNQWSSPELKKDAVKAAVQRNIRRVCLFYVEDVASTDRIGVDFNDEAGGVLSVGVALGARDMSRWNADHPLRVVIGNVAAKDAADVRLTAAAAAVTQYSGVPISIAADWPSLTSTRGFSGQKDVVQRQKIMAVAAQAEALADVVQEVSQHDVGRAALHQKLRSVRFAGIEEGGSKPQYSFGDDGVLAISLSNDALSARPNTLLTPLRLRWLLGALLDFERATGDSRIAEQTAAVRPNLKSNAFKSEVDWSFLEQPEFLALTPEEQSNICTTLSALVVKQVLRGLVGVCEHPIGLKCVQDNIAAFKLTFDVSGKAAPIKQNLRVEGKDLVLRTSDVTLAEAAAARYKERIEFAYDLVVAIAVDNAKPAKATLEANLGSTSAGGALSFQLDVPLEFTKTDTFRAIEPPKQADIITCLYSLPALGGTNNNSSNFDAFMAIVHHEPVVKALQATSNGSSSIVVTARVHEDDSVPSPGVWSISPAGNGLVFDISLSDVLPSTRVVDWCPRALDCLSLVEVVGRLETSETFASLWATTTAALGCSAAQPLALEIDWDSMVASAEYQGLPAEQRLAAVKSLQTTVVQCLFHGDDAITGARGLSEFKQVCAAIREAVRRVLIVVDPANACPGTVVGGAVGAGATLTLCVGLRNVRAADTDASQVNGVAKVVETALKLRPVREAAAVARGAERVAAGCQAVCVPVRVDWEHFVNTDKVKQDEFGYVAQIDAAATKAVRTIAAGENSFSDLGLDGSFGQGLLQSKNVKEIVVAFDTTNEISSNPGVTHGLIPRSMKALQRPGGVVVVNVNQSSRGIGCGRQVQYALDPNGARRDETACRDRMASRMRADEQARRERAITSAQNDNVRAQEQYSREQERYQRDMQKHQEELRSSCYSCSGKRLKKCGQVAWVLLLLLWAVKAERTDEVFGVFGIWWCDSCLFTSYATFLCSNSDCRFCNGKGTTTNNNNVSTCRICHGRTQVDCSSCRGTGLRSVLAPTDLLYFLFSASMMYDVCAACRVFLSAMQALDLHTLLAASLFLCPVLSRTNRYPNGKSAPRAPSALRLKDIPTFGAMPDYTHQI